MEAYKRLEERFAQLTALRQIDSLIDWDRSVMMPEKGIDLRATQAAALNVVMHEKMADPQVGEWLAKTDRKALDPWQRANVEMMEWLYRHETATPAALVAKRMMQEAKTELVWRRARAESDFGLVRDDLEKLLGIVREQAEAKGAALKKSPYDALMDWYAPHMLSKDVDVIFDDLAQFLPPFIAAVLEVQKEPLGLPAVPVEKQQRFGRQLAELLGFDFSWGRLDVSAHPFSMGVGNDVRITTRYNENDFMRSAQCVAHEAGHGFYDHHTPEEWWGQPVGRSQNMGMVIHESQSLSLDMQLGRCREYWEFLSPHLQETFGVSGPAWSGENLYRHAIRVERGFIRVEADEVTYPAHVILRYRLEKRMIEGALEVKDLPEAWNAEMQAMIGVTTPSDRLGCLQDIHWYSGAFGYFPAYALGALTAAQLAARMRQDIPSIPDHIRKGEFKVFIGWLRDNVQSKACLYKPQELVEKVTGAPVTAHFFKQHLHERYLEGASCSTTSARGEKRRA